MDLINHKINENIAGEELYSVMPTHSTSHALINSNQLILLQKLSAGNIQDSRAFNSVNKPLYMFHRFG